MQQVEFVEFERNRDVTCYSEYLLSTTLCYIKDCFIGEANWLISTLALCSVEFAFGGRGLQTLRFKKKITSPLKKIRIYM